MRTQVKHSLQQIELELRNLHWWENQAPSAQALASSQPFCLDSLSFAQWLQWVLLPRMSYLLDQQLPLPESCAVAAMADMVYQDQLAQTAALRKQLEQLDSLFATDSDCAKNSQQT